MNRFDRTALYAALLLVVVALDGCANPEAGFQSALTATATTLTAGYRAAEDYDAAKKQTLKSVDEYNVYKAGRDKAMKVLATVADSVRAGYVAIKAADASKRKDWGNLTVDIIAGGIQVIDALKQWGVTIPGVQ